MNGFLKRSWIVIILLIVANASCKDSAQTTKVNTEDLLSNSIYNLTDVIIHDIFSPPVASRIYAYSTLAYYEGLKFQEPKAESITKKLRGFDEIPAPDSSKSYDFYLVAATAFYSTAEMFVFSKDTLRNNKEKLLMQFKEQLPEDRYNNSIALGDAISEAVVKRTTKDNYTKTRGMPRFSVFKEPGKWQQTSPDYSDALEPYWNSISPLLLDSSNQFIPTPPPIYSLDKKSEYYRELLEVYNISKQLTPEQDTIARYWDDNSFVTTHQGHLTYANKKTTPGGHWMGITSILCNQENVSALRSAKIFALTACSIFDGFIACWDEKYRSNKARPITVIQEEIDANWSSLLQTPPFPECTSGHSVISSAAATVLTHFLGDSIGFTDTTEMKYLGLKRSFSSIDQAANEAGVSRLYGGIHFRSAITLGTWQGQQVGDLYVSIFR